MKQIFKPVKSMFGVDSLVNDKNLRDKEEPREAS